MHLDTWKQLDMVGVNHLCMVQGNEESTSLFFLCLFCIFMVMVMVNYGTMPFFVESDGNDDRVNYRTMPFIL